MQYSTVLKRRCAVWIIVSLLSFFRLWDQSRRIGLTAQYTAMYQCMATPQCMAMHQYLATSQCMIDAVLGSRGLPGSGLTYSLVGCDVYTNAVVLRLGKCCFEK
jgi:uncharacterized membrane protein YhhN